MRKILTVALLASTLAVPALAADLTPAVNADTQAAVTTPAPQAKPAVALKSGKKAMHKHIAHKAKKVQNKTM